MKKISMMFMVLVSAVIASMVFFSATAQAEAGNLVGVIKADQVPAWVKGHEETVKTKFVDAYTTAGFTVQPEAEIVPLDLGKARVMLYQRVGDEGAIILNEVNGKAFTIDNKAMLDVIDGLTGDQRAILMAVVEVEGVEYFVTDEGITSLVDGVPTAYQYSVGRGTDIQFWDVALNEFTKAYKWAENYVAPLGLPIGPVTIKEYNTRDLKSDGTYVTGTPTPTSVKKYTSQQFDNGYIIHARMANPANGNYAVQHGAAPILNAMYDKVIGLEGNATLNITGAPVSIQYVIDGVTYQNFEYGYVKVDAEGAITFVQDLVVDTKGTEMNRRIGAGESFNNWLKDDGYQLAWERLRVGQNFRNALGQMIRDGRQPYKTSVADPLGDGRIHHVPHEFNGVGVVHIFKDGWGETIGWGNVFVVQGAWYNEAHEYAPVFNAYINERVALGRPSEDWTTLYNATYQVFEKGIAYTNGNVKEFKAGEDYTAWLNGETVEQALQTHGIAEAEHTVTFVDYDGTVLKTEKVAHGGAAIPPADPTRLGYTFNSWEGDYSNIITSNVVIKATYDAQQGNPETGKNKFMNFDVTETTGTFWYDNDARKIEVNATLYDAWRAYKESVAEAIKVSGYPVYADETNLITTTKWFYIEGEVVMTKDTLGTLPTDVEVITELNKNVAIGTNERKIIQDSFADAFIFANERGEHSLGLPVGPVTIEKEFPNPSNTAEYYEILVQEFENGKIVQVGYNRAAYPIYSEMLAVWEKAEVDGGAGGVNGIGAPTSRQYTHEGKTYQNFRYGYIVAEGTTVDIKFVEGKQVNFHGVEVDARFGRFVDRNTARNAHPEFEHEFLRTYELYMELHTRYTDAGYVFGLLVEPNVIAWNGYGATQGFSMSSSTANVWGQTKFTPIPLKSPFDKPHIVRNNILVQWADLKGNEINNGALGFPLDDDFKIVTDVTFQEETKQIEVWYQNFEVGYIRSYLVGDTQVVEYFKEYKVTPEGKHVKIADGVEAEVPAFNLSGFEEEPAADKTELVSKLEALKTARAGILEQVGDLKDLPKTNMYMTKAQLAEIDAEITRLETLAAREDLTEEEIATALIDIQANRLKITNQAKAGQASEVKEPPTGGLDGGALFGIIAGSVAALAIAVFLVLKFVVKKRV